jgi:hypothetical protein
MTIDGAVANLVKDPIDAVNPFPDILIEILPMKKRGLTVSFFIYLRYTHFAFTIIVLC